MSVRLLIGWPTLASWPMAVATAYDAVDLAALVRPQRVVMRIVSESASGVVVVGRTETVSAWERAQEIRCGSREDRQVSTWVEKALAQVGNNAPASMFDKAYTHLRSNATILRKNVVGKPRAARTKRPCNVKFDIANAQGIIGEYTLRGGK